GKSRAAALRPGGASRHTYLPLLLCPVRRVARHAEKLLEVFLAQADARTRLLDDPKCRLATNSGELALEPANTGLSGIAVDDEAHGAFGHLHLRLAEAVLAKHLGQYIAPPDGDLLLLSVTR